MINGLPSRLRTPIRMRIVCPRNWLVLLVFISLVGPGRAQECIGPFASWGNVKTGFGAVGDGITDDTAAIQGALEALRLPAGKMKVLYFPAGVYRITRTLQVLRTVDNDSLGITIIGEHPATAIIRWDGPADGRMIEFGAWLSKISRLTLDGAGRAGVALWHGPMFSTGNEDSDLIIKDVAIGIQAGSWETYGQAETAVLRCQFLRCSEAGFFNCNYNSFDWFFWQCRFEDCDYALTNVTRLRQGCGNFQAYDCVFLRSKSADAAYGNLGYFSLVRNISIGSAKFVAAAGSMCWSSPTTLQGNSIIDPQPKPEYKGAVIFLWDPGPWLLLDNVVRTTDPRPPVQAGWTEAEAVAVGNTFTVDNPVAIPNPAARYFCLDETIVDPAQIPDPIINLPSPPPWHQGPVVEVQAGAGADQIQQAIDQAAQLAGQRPVVHLPPGMYNISRPLVIPASCDLILAGENIRNATTLNWNGEGEGPMILIQGPSHASVRDMELQNTWSARAPVGIRVTGCDQTGGRVHMEQVFAMGHFHGLDVEGLDDTYVSLHDFYHNGIHVTGGPRTAQGLPTESRTEVFMGSSSRQDFNDWDTSLCLVENGGRLLLRDVYYEGAPPWLLKLSDSGEFCWHSAMINQIPHPAGPTILFDHFKGKVLLSQAQTFRTEVKATAENPDLKLLLQGWVLGSWGETGIQLAPGLPNVGLLQSRQEFLDEPLFAHIPNLGNNQPAFIRDMMEPLRTRLPRPLTPPVDGTTNLLLYRLMITGRVGIRLEAAQGVPSSQSEKKERAEKRKASIAVSQ